MRATPREGTAVRGWAIASAPRRFAVFVGATNVASVAVVVAALVIAGPGSLAPWTLAWLLGLALVFEEGARRAARLQIRLSSALRIDMTSVWAVAAAVALEPGAIVAMLSTLCVYAWYRQWRPAGEQLYRKWFVSSTMVVGGLAASWASQTVEQAFSGRTPALGGAAGVVVAILVYTGFNRAMVTCGLRLVGVPWRDLAGSRHDNLLELATLCLGGLLALAVLFEPWLAVLVIAPMVTLQRGALVRDLEAAAITDAKTGLLNATAWEQLAQREIARAARDVAALGVLIIDIDRFKGVNDRHGHLVGDQVLAGIARALKAAVREYDGVGRFGGEEFVAVLPDADQHDALVVAERIRARVNQLCVSDISDRPVLDDRGQGEDRLSVSVGVAVLGTNGDELSDLLHAADRALYRAKWNGRNQVQLAQNDGGAPERITS
ncbi:GGDEF domain-containing protein [Jatrophihabitans fulvus]